MQKKAFTLWIDHEGEGWYAHSTHATYEDAEYEGEQFDYYYVDFTEED